MKSLCVFCGSRPGDKSEFVDAARHMGGLLAAKGFRTIFGGGSRGMMGAVADGALAAGGQVIGVIPRGLFVREGLHEGLTELKVVASMHERKALMANLADGFIALPGGIGTMEELFEVWTWAQLGVHQKPCGMLNVEGYYDPLLQFVDHMLERAFLEPYQRNLLKISTDAESVIAHLTTFDSPPTKRWIDENQT